MRILIVEDDSPLRDAIAMVLREEAASQAAYSRCALFANIQAIKL
ncbi:response regulator transcription factor [Paenibacillus sp. OV219]|nr:response regulator transcription factor [Paenibacillus sp. OV219]